MDEQNNVLGFESDDYRWLVIIVKDNRIRGGVFTDLKELGNKVGVSDKTIRRRLKEMNGEQRVKINGFTIVKMPYFKSKRGGYNESGE
jgi:hypothetical protein